MSVVHRCLLALATSLTVGCQASDEEPLLPAPLEPAAPVVPPELPETVEGSDPKQVEPPPVVRGGAGFELVTVAEGLSEGVGFAFAPGDRIYIVEKRGVVRLVRGGQLLATPVLDISREVNAAQDRGLLGVAVHPRFPELPYLYLVHVYDPPEVWMGEQVPTNDAAADGNGARASRLVRVELDPSTDYASMVAGSEVVLLGTGSTYENINGIEARNDYDRPACGASGSYARDCLPADENSHTIGTVAFGPDGMLYVGNGDGCDYVSARASCTRALDVESLSGKIMRIDPLTGKGLPDNPFYDGDPDSNRSKVYQLGLRNPFRFSFDRQSGALYVGDVGWNVWEEINRAGPGASFGWPCYEGGNGISIEQSGYADVPVCSELRSSGQAQTPAIYAYTHEGMLGNAVLVGDVYHGTSYPPLYANALFYTDYGTRQIRFLAFDGRGAVASSQLVVGPVGFLTQISADPVTGDLFMMRIGSSPEMPGSALDRLVFRGYGNGPGLGAFHVTARARQACLEVVPGFDGLPGSVESRPCSDAPAQHLVLELLQGDVYLLHPEGSTRSLTARARPQLPSVPTFEDTASDAPQTFRAYPLRDGYQLIDAASELCLSAPLGELAPGLLLARCADVDAQLFDFAAVDNQPPLLEGVADQLGTLGDSVQLLLTASDPEGIDLTFFASGLPPGLSIDPRNGLLTGELTKPGSYRVTVRVSDGKLDATRAFTYTVRDDQLPDVVIDAPVDGYRITIFELIQFAGHATDSSGAPIPAYDLFWELYTHHLEHIHFGGLPETRGASGTFVVADHGDNTAYELCLNATDGLGRLGRTCRVLRPREVELMLDTEPSGLQVSWEGIPRTTPVTLNTQINALRNIVVATDQGGYAFVDWVDGQPANRWITVADHPQRLVARFAPKQ